MSIHLKMKNISTILLTALLGCWMMTGMTSCKTEQKKAEEAAAMAKAQKIEATKQKLQKLLANNDMTAAAMQTALDQILKSAPNDPSLNALIGQVKEKINNKKAEEEAKLAEEKRKQEEEARRKAEELERQKRQAHANSTEGKVENGLEDIATASSSSVAYQKMDDVLQLFASEQTPVLVVIYESPEGKRDYDKPKYVVTFLEYVKDTKKGNYSVVNVKKNADGKITMLELKPN